MCLLYRIAVLAMLFIPTAIIAQTYDFIYGYDATGNRTSRTFSLKSAIIPPKDTVSITKEFSQTKQEIFEDKIGDYNIRIFPNPTKGFVNIEIPDIAQQSAHIRIFGTQGNQIQSVKVKGNYTRIDLSTQPPGVYFLKIIIAGHSSDWKVIKE